jgi:hypothetical protein
VVIFILGGVAALITALAIKLTATISISVSRVRPAIEFMFLSPCSDMCLFPSLCVVEDLVQFLPAIHGANPNCGQYLEHPIRIGLWMPAKGIDQIGRVETIHCPGRRLGIQRPDTPGPLLRPQALLDGAVKIFQEIVPEPFQRGVRSRCV